MDKTAFKADTLYTVSLRDEQGRARPANLYIHRTYDQFMIARHTANDGLLCKILYGDVLKIVRAAEPDSHHLRATPAAVLDEKNWKDKTVMQHYASAPGLGK